LIRLDGEPWKQQRAALNPSFAHAHLKNVVGIFNQDAQKLVNAWAEKISTNGTIDVQDWMTRFTLDIIGHAGFGYDFQALSDGKSKIHEQYLICVNFLMNPIRFMIPFINSIPIPYVQRAVAAQKAVKSLMRDIIEKKRASKDASRCDILDAMLHTQENNVDIDDEEDLDTYKHKKEIVHMNDKQLSDNLFVFFLAGHETSSTALTWVFYELAKNQDVQTKAREEVFKILGKNKTPNWDDLNKLDYIHMILKEILRLWAPSIGIVKTTKNPTKILGYNIPVGTFTLLSIFNVHRNPDVWPNPNKFDPERFTQDNSQNRHPYAWIPFSAGPKSCIGNKFALLEMKVLLASVLQKFKFTIDPNYKVEFDKSITIRPKPTLPITFSLV